MKNIDKIYKTDYSKHDIITHTFNEMVKELPRNGHIIDWIATEHYHYLENIFPIYLNLKELTWLAYV